MKIFTLIYIKRLINLLKSKKSKLIKYHLWTEALAQ